MLRSVCYQSSVTPENQEYSGSEAKLFFNKSPKWKPQWPHKKVWLLKHWRIQSGGKGARDECAPPTPPNPISFIFMQFSAKLLRNSKFSPPLQGAGAPPRLGNPGSATVKEIFAQIFSFSFPQVHTYDEDSCSCRCNNEHDAVRCAANQHWENMQCACMCNEKPSCARDEVFNNSTCRYWSFP